MSPASQNLLNDFRVFYCTQLMNLYYLLVISSIKFYLPKHRSGFMHSLVSTEAPGHGKPLCGTGLLQRR